MFPQVTLGKQISSERGGLILSRSNVNLYAMKNFAENYHGKTAQRGNTFTCPRREIKKEREGGN